ncbi:MAG: DUF4157 domain-containing protein, partial [Spirulinaceae cyanobacterium]
LNHSLQAKAFATGQDVFFRPGAYAPLSRSGQELIAHELTHVVQQGGAGVQKKSQQNKVSRKDVSTPKSEVLTHLQSVKGKANHDPSIYRQEIKQLQAKCETCKTEEDSPLVQKKSLGNEEALDNEQVSENDPQQLAQIDTSPLSPKVPGSLEIHFKPVATPVTPAHHAFIILRKPSFFTGLYGATNFYRGGPSGNMSGHIVTKYGLYKEGSVDWTTNPTEIVKLQTFESIGAFENYDKKLREIMHQIEAARIKYSLPSLGGKCSDGANSNSTVYYAVEQLGFTPGEPPVRTPCWEVDPFKVNRQVSIEKIEAYNRYMAAGYREGQNGVNNPSKAYAHYNNAIANFQLALQTIPDDKKATAKLAEFRNYKNQVRQQYDNYMQEGWAAIERGQSARNTQQKIREYNTALINFQRAYNRISIGKRGENALREINKVKSFINSLN